MDDRNAAHRAAMLFLRSLPAAKAGFVANPGYSILKIATPEFCRLTELQRFGRREQARLATQLAEYSLFIVGDDDYVLLIGMHDPQSVPTASLAGHIDEIVAETSTWDQARWDAEWDKTFPDDH
jgi:hypothetical protein